MNVHLKAICVYICLVFGTWSYLSFNQYKIIVLSNLTGSKCLSYILFMFTSNSANDFDHISNESFPLPNAYNVILRIRLQEITQQSNIKTTAVREWESGVHTALHCKYITFQNQTHFVEFVNNSALFRNNSYTIPMNAKFDQQCISGINCLVLFMHAVLMKLKIFSTKYHVNYFMANGCY